MTTQELINSLPYTPSKYQIGVWEFVEKENGHAVINAVAGSGKTTTIVEALKLIPSNQSSAFFAFNKAIVGELEKRVPSHTVVKTLHGFGFSCLKRANNKIRLDNYKVNNIVKELNKSQWAAETPDGKPHPYDYCITIMKLVDLAKVNLLQTEEELESEGIKHDLELYNGECKKALEVLRLSNAKDNIIDFNDMIYLPAIRNIYIPFFDFVFVDECQDLNRAQQELVKKACGNRGRRIAVGDPRQAIYGFAGADVESFNRLSSLENTKILPLSVNYRCGKQALELVEEIVPEFEVFEGSEEGEINYAASHKDIRDGDLVLCRNTAPLIKMCFDYLKQGKKAYVKGKDLGKNLINLIKKAGDITEISDLITYLYGEKEVKFNLLSKKNPHLLPEEVKSMNQYVLLEMKIEAIEVFIEEGARNVPALMKKIEDIFKDESEGIILSTIHKAKGLESNNVYIIEEQLMPSRYAIQEWQKEQEENLKYVAYTRWKKILGFVTDWNFKQGGTKK